MPTVREVNLFEIRDSCMSGPIKDIKEATGAENIPADPHVKEEDAWTDQCKVDWEEAESETDVEEEVKAIKKGEHSDSEEECPREA